MVPDATMATFVVITMPVIAVVALQLCLINVPMVHATQTPANALLRLAGMALLMAGKNVANRDSIVVRALNVAIAPVFPMVHAAMDL